MRLKCSVRNCKNNKYNSTLECSLYQFPNDNELAELWSAFCQLENGTINPKKCYVCMEHFTDDDFENNMKFKMGFARKRVLKRGVIPSLKNELPEGLVTYVFEPLEEFSPGINENEISFSKDDTLDTLDPLSEEPTETNEGYILISKSAKCKKRILQKIDTLQEKIEFLLKQNYCLRENQQNLVNKVKALRRRSVLAEKRHFLNTKQLQKRLLRAELLSHNIEERLKTFLTEGQIKKLHNGSKRIIWTQEDMVQSFALYCVSSKAYKLLFQQGFPLPAIRTLQAWNHRM